MNGTANGIELHPDDLPPIGSKANAVIDDDLMRDLEVGVRKILKGKKTTPAERIAAVNAGVKLLAIRYKIAGGDEKGFFS